MLSPNAQVVGCTCGGVVGKNGPNESIKALAIMAIKGPKDEFAVSGTDILVNDDLHEIFFQLARDLKNKIPGINMIFCHPGASNQAMITVHAEKIFGGIESVLVLIFLSLAGCLWTTINW
jgi:hypothetical protein